MTADPRHLGADRWKVSMYAGYDPITGKRHRRSRSFRAPNLQTARRKADKIRTELRAEITEGAAHRDTIAGLAEQWLDLCRRDKSPSTVRSYELHTRDVVARFGKIRVAALTPRAIDRWYSDLAVAGMAPVSIHKRHVTLRVMLNQAVKWGMVDRVATKQTTPPRLTGRAVESTMPTWAALEVLVNGTTGDVRMALEVAIATGCRRGEVVGLRWDDLDASAGKLRVARSILHLSGQPMVVKQTKGRRERVLDIDGGLVVLLGAHGVKHAGSPWMFPDYRADPSGGVPRSPGWLSGAWTRLRPAGVRVRLHDLRHLAASTALDAGVSVVEVAAFLGHAQVSTTQNTYAHAIPGERGRSSSAIVAARTRALGPAVMLP